MTYPTPHLPHCCLLLLTFACASAFADPASDFRALCLEKSTGAEKAGSAVIAGRDGWLFFDSELRHLGVGKFWGDAAAKVSRAQKPDQADPLPAILDFKRQLDQAGIKLLVAPVPAKASVYPHMLDARFSPEPRIDQSDREFLELLARNGIAALDLVGPFLTDKDAAHGELYCRQDTHWSGRACAIAASAIAVRIKELAPGLPSRLRLQSQWRDIEITGDLWRDLPEPRPSREKLAVRFVGQSAPGGLQAVDDDESSPVVLLGDSHCLIFHDGQDMHSGGAGLADQLALELGLAVDLVATRGSGATPARVNFARRARREGYLAGKKLVVWCFSVREFTESAGWAIVSVAGR